MKFSPEFYLLRKFTLGLPPLPRNENDILAAARYLGVDLVAFPSDDHEALLVDELQQQNRLLSTHLDNSSIFETDAYRKSMFIREVVANNRLNIKERTAGG